MSRRPPALGQGEADRLHALLMRLAASGTAVLYVSHRLDDVLANCDRMTVLRNGCTVAAGLLADETRDGIVLAMSGRKRDLAAPAHKRTTPSDGEPVLSVRDVPWGRERTPLSLDVRTGEIVGLYGLVGAGRCRTLTGGPQRRALFRVFFAMAIPPRVLRREGLRRIGVSAISAHGTSEVISERSVSGSS